jgi:hypothetical protein
MSFPNDKKNLISGGNYIAMENIVLNHKGPNSILLVER